MTGNSGSGATVGYWKPLAASGGPPTAAQLGLDGDFYREAVCHAREIRKR
jgi:hypothetical protein